MDQARTAPRPMITALLAALALALLTLAITAGLPGLAADLAGNGWHKTGDAPIAGNGWHNKGATTLAGNGWHSITSLGNGWH
jgi:opacity protein-like surface antigen